MFQSKILFVIVGQFIEIFKYENVMGLAEKNTVYGAKEHIFEMF